MRELSVASRKMRPTVPLLAEENRRPFLPTHKFISESILEEMTKGSYEKLLEALHRAVKRDRSLFVEGFGETVKPIATFKGRSILYTSAGRFLRVEWKDENGEVKFTKVEPVNDVPVMSFEDVTKSTLDALTKSILGGKLDDAKAVIRESFGILTFPGVQRPTDLSRLMRENMGVSRIWRRYVESRQDEMRSILSITEGEVSPVKAKYRGIWEGAEEGDLTRFNDVVREDANALLGRLSSICESARKAFDEYVKIRPAFRGLSENETPAQFEMMAEDFFTESEMVRDTAVNILHSGNVVAMAEAHDAILEHIHEFELAGRFVKAMAENLLKGRNN